MLGKRQASKSQKGTEMGTGTPMKGERRGLRAFGFTLALIAAAVCLAGLFAPAGQAGDLKVPVFNAPGLDSDHATASTLAGGRPSELVNAFFLNRLLTPESGFFREPAGAAGENVRNLSFDLPPGVVGNAASFPRCSQEAFSARSCSPSTQIGVADIVLTAKQHTDAPVFNLTPPPGMPAQFAFLVSNAANIHINFHVRTGSDYGVTASLIGLNEGLGLLDSNVTVWGVPGDPSHDSLRYDSKGARTPGPYPEPPPYRPFLSNPTSCGGPLVTTMEATTWQLPREVTSAAPFEAPAMVGCDAVDFDPTIEAKPTTTLGDSPSGLDFNLHIPQNQDADGRATAHLRESRVALPASLTVNPSSANGLGACSLQQIGYLGSSTERQLLKYDLPPSGFSGSFTVNFKGQATEPISAGAPRVEVTQAIETLPGLAGNVALRGAPGGWIVAFTGALTGTDVPDLTGVVTNNPSQTLAVTGDGGGFNLHFGDITAGASFETSFAAGASLFIAVSNVSRPLSVGDPIEGPGIAPGTEITAVFFGGSFINISNPTTEAKTSVKIKTELLFDASAEEIQAALQEVPALGHDNIFPGNVFVSATGGSGSTHSFQLIFAEELAGTKPVLTATNALTGAGAGVVITQQEPATPHVLDVSTLTGGIVPGSPQFNPDPATCPDSARLGTVRIDSPAVIDHPLTGSVYLATPHQNPFGSLLALYIAVNDPQTGIVVKLPGRLELDQKTGQLTATVSQAPQLPFEDLRLEFFKGAAAPLKTGIACGKYEVATDMTPWTAPEGATKHPRDSFAIDKGAGGGACAGSEAQAPNAPTFEAGTADPVAGAYSPFTLKLSRADGTQQLTGIDTNLPAGLVARLAGVPYCSEADLALAAGKAGKSEQASPSCPAASRVGSVTVGAGAGPKPYYAGGAAYLAGPYKGAPLSLAVITPAVAGPFDLGTVVVRNALYLNPETTQVRAVSDPFPSILQGIPLDLRSVLVNLDRGRFTKNPTNCAPFEITGAAAALTGQSAPVSNHFQVGDCGRLKFGPKLKLSLKGGTQRTDHPALKAVLTARQGEANIARAAVTLPKSEFLENAHIKTICTRVQYAADVCPAKSIYGYAKAWTPLLDEPLRGPVYLRSSSNTLPDLVASLDGQIHVDLVGRIDSTDARIRNTFDLVPDAPVSKFVLEMQGGKKGLLVNNRNLCKSTSRARVLFDGQNGKTSDSSPVVAPSCKKRPGKKK